jgi:hypothetical protein
MSQLFSTQADSIQVKQLVPISSDSKLESILNNLLNSPQQLPFSDEVVNFVSDFSLALSRGAKGFAEIQALAYWMRKASIMRLKESFEELTSKETHLMPRGLVFHIPPANVDTIFIYSLVLSLICGNKNLVRLSSRTTQGSDLMIEILNQTLKKFPNISAGISMISYPHDKQITDLISKHTDTRVIWGGDKTISSVRESPLPVHSTELSFADRFSMAAINNSAYASLGETGKEKLVESFYNDSYWFDQMGCSSPRLLIWVGEINYTNNLSNFFIRLERLTEKKKYSSDTATVIAKLASSYSTAIGSDDSSISTYGNNITVVNTSEFPQIRGVFCGGGLFHVWNTDQLLNLSNHLDRKDQTLSVFGFTNDELQSFVHNAAGRGIDRIVDIGAALNFDRFWDGNDLLQSFTRRVSVKISSSKDG